MSNSAPFSWLQWCCRGAGYRLDLTPVQLMDSLMIWPLVAPGILITYINGRLSRLQTRLLRAYRSCWFLLLLKDGGLPVWWYFGLLDRLLHEHPSCWEGAGSLTGQPSFAWAQVSRQRKFPSFSQGCRLKLPRNNTVVVHTLPTYHIPPPSLPYPPSLPTISPLPP